MLSSFRQLKYPKEFRISPTVWPQDLMDSSDKIVELLLSPQNDNQEWQKFIKDISTGIWRIKNRLDSEEQPSHEVRSAKRFLQATVDVLEQSGVKIIDHDKQRIIGGEMLRILSYETIEHLDHAKVIETIKPTILLNDYTIQIGEVIVGTPQVDEVNEIFTNNYVD